MGGTIFLIICYIAVIGEIAWFFTCTEHKDIPLLAAILVSAIGLIPGMHCVCAIGFILLFILLHDKELMTLKNNWFNRTFLGYDE